MSSKADILAFLDSKFSKIKAKKKKNKESNEPENIV